MNWNWTLSSTELYSFNECTNQKKNTTKQTYRCLHTTMPLILKIVVVWFSTIQNEFYKPKLKKKIQRNSKWKYTNNIVCAKRRRGTSQTMSYSSELRFVMILERWAFQYSWMGRKKRNRLVFDCRFGLEILMPIVKLIVVG